MFYLLIRHTWKVELEGFKNNCLLETQDMWPFLAGRPPFRIYDPQYNVQPGKGGESQEAEKLRELGTWLRC